MPATKYGDCSAYLFMSRKYGVDYGDVLAVADYLTHNRQICRPFDRLFLSNQMMAWLPGLGTDRADALLRDIGLQVQRFKALRAGTESGNQSEPQGISWWTPESVAKYLPEHS